MSNRTSLGRENEDNILAELEPIIKKWAKKTDNEVRYIKSAVAFLWKDIQEDADKAWDDYMSANEIGPYGGR